MDKTLVIDFQILESIKDLQTQHGLKYENFHNYRSYCSRRLHRLRRSLNVHQGIPSSAKARHQRGRKLMDVSNAMVLEAGEKDPNYGERMLIIPLCLAERAWAYAMQLKQETPDQPRKRFHLIRRLRKAAEHAERFEKLVHDPESPCSDRTKEEATAYASYITGLYKVECCNWSEAKEDLSRALAILFKLSVSIKDGTVLEHYRQRIEELRASLRYCAFNLGEQDVRKKSKTQLPANLQFHDLAFRHAKLLEQESPQPKKVEQDKEEVKMDTSEQLPQAVASADDDEDEFEETREAIGDESDQEDEESDEDEDEDKGQSRVGGVTGLVKNWLGGAWS